MEEFMGSPAIKEKTSGQDTQRLYPSIDKVRSNLFNQLLPARAYGH